MEEYPVSKGSRVPSIEATGTRRGGRFDLTNVARPERIQTGEEVKTEQTSASNYGIRTVLGSRARRTVATVLVYRNGMLKEGRDIMKRSDTRTFDAHLGG